MNKTKSKLIRIRKVVRFVIASKVVQNVKKTVNKKRIYYLKNQLNKVNPLNQLLNQVDRLN